MHVLLLIGRETVSPRHLAAMIELRFYPIDVVHIGDPGDQDAQMDFLRVGNEDLGRPLPSAVLLRPDGHVAWIAPRFYRRAQMP